MLRTLWLAIISTHMEITTYSLFEGGQISALLMAAGIDRLWVRQYIKAGKNEDGSDQVTTFKVDTDFLLWWKICKFKKLVNNLNWEQRGNMRVNYYDVKFMVPVRDSKEIEALA